MESRIGWALPLTLVLLVFSSSASRRARAEETVNRAYLMRPWISNEHVLREEIEARNIAPDHPLARWYRESWSEALARAPYARHTNPTHSLGGPSLAPDVRTNDRSPVTCSGCAGLPIIQSEAGIGIHGSNVLVTWNEGEVSCGTNSRGNFAWSTNGGQTFTDGGGYPGPGVRLAGDGTVAVNHKTGEFYVGALIFSGAPSGVGVARGSFGAGGYTVESVVAVAAGSGTLLDKPWIAVDSLSGNVYLTWTRFGPKVQIEMMRLDAALNILGPIQAVSDTSCGAQYSQPIVGPDGELTVMWQSFRCSTDFIRTVRTRRSTDFGVTFGPIVEVTATAVNSFNGAPGFGRRFAPYQQYATIDATNGPHRGRTYVTFDASVNYHDDVIPNVSTFETEPNNSYLQANSLEPGGRLRGSKGGAEEDWFQIHMNAGETFYFSTVYCADFQCDSTLSPYYSRVWCLNGGSLEQVANATALSGGVMFSALNTATYYLQLYNSPSDGSTGTYVFEHAIIPPAAGDVALDHRDQLMMWSDDGINWSTPIRLNDTAPGVDGVYPSIAVDGRGRVHAVWMDFREDPVCGVLSSQYMRSSGDGGLTWGPSRPLSDATTSWGGPVCNQLNNNNQGDYQSMAADGDRVAAAFTDARTGDPDIFADVSIHSAGLACVPPVTAVEERDTTVQLSFTNQGNFTTPLSWQIEDTQGWLTGAVPAASGTTPLGAGGTQNLAVTLHPTACAGDSSELLLIVSDPAIPGYLDTCRTVVRCTTTTGVPGGPVAWFLAPPRPNPSAGAVRLRFGLPRRAPVQLTVHSLTGARVRTVIAESRDPGVHDVAWDGRDERGNLARSGGYFVRLESGDVKLRRTVFLMR